MDTGLLIKSARLCPSIDALDYYPLYFVNMSSAGIHAEDLRQKPGVQ